MQLSETLKLKLNKETKQLLTVAMIDYIQAVNETVEVAIAGTDISKYSSKDISVNLPSAIRGQITRDSRSIVKKHYRFCHKAVLKNRKSSKNPESKNRYVLAPKLPVLRKPCLYVNNQNFKVRENSITFPLMVNGQSKRIEVPCPITERQKQLLCNSELGTLRIVMKNGHIVAQITYEAPEQIPLSEGNIMGIDLGIKCPAVSYCSDEVIRFYGNGRKNKYLRRHYAYLRKKLQTAKKQKVVERINNKEQRIMRDIDHKLSHDIIKNAVASNANVIKLERLENIRSTTRTSRKNNHSLHTWSFYRLAQFIEYKATLAGIKVEYVNPAYTSQRCPSCGDIHHAKDRKYTCSCGFHAHRDVVGAINICASTVIVGNRQSA